MKRRVTKALAELKAGEPGGGGLVIRLGPGPTLLGTPDTGLDDATYQKFTHDTFGPEATREIPGVESTDPDRFAVRSKYLAGVGRMPWLTWRSKEIATLYAELNAAVRAARPRRRCWPWSRPAWTAVRPAARPGGSIARPFRPASRGGASGSISRPGRAGPARRWSCAERPSRPKHSRTTWPPARISTRWSRLAPHRGLLLAIGGEAAADDPGGSPPAPAPEPLAPGLATGFLAADPEDREGRCRMPAAGAPAARREPADLADRAAAGRRPGRRRAARARTRGARCTVGLPGRKGRLGPGRAAAPLRTRAARPSGQGRRRPTPRPTPSPSRSASWCEI